MLNVESFLVNPQSGSSNIASRQLIIRQLSFETQGLIAANLLHLASVKLIASDVLRVHIKIGSKSIRNLFYDVIIDFHNIKRIKNDKQIDGVSKKDCEIKVFSNSPDFTFTYAYVMNKKNHLIKEFIPYYESEVLSLEPKIKNPSKLLGFSSSIYHALYYLELIGFYGNYNYAKFINNVNLKPLTTHQIKTETNRLRLANKSGLSKQKKK